MDQILHIPLLNFIFFLHYEKKQVFCDWVALNQAANEELGFGSGGLRQITSDKNNLLYKALIEHDFKAPFLSMTDKDEQSLNVHKKSFKDEKKRYCFVAFALKTFNDDIEEWRSAF